MDRTAAQGSQQVSTETDGTTPLPLDRLLDSLVEQVLAEAAAAPAAMGETSDVRDPVEAFLGDAAAFLRGRGDATALIERLRMLVADAGASHESDLPEADCSEGPRC